MRELRSKHIGRSRRRPSLRRLKSPLTVVALVGLVASRLLLARPAQRRSLNSFATPTSTSTSTGIAVRIAGRAAGTSEGRPRSDRGEELPNPVALAGSPRQQARGKLVESYTGPTQGWDAVSDRMLAPPGTKKASIRCWSQGFGEASMSTASTCGPRTTPRRPIRRPGRSEDSSPRR